MDVEVDIQTDKTYMLFKSYICAMEHQGLKKRNKYQMWKTDRYGSHVEMRWNTYLQGKSHSNINVANWETNQK